MSRKVGDALHRSIPRVTGIQVDCNITMIRVGRVLANGVRLLSLDRPHKSPQVATFDPFLPFSPAALTPPFTHFANNLGRPPNHYASRRNDHGWWDHSTW